MGSGCKKQKIVVEPKTVNKTYLIKTQALKDDFYQRYGNIVDFYDFDTDPKGDSYLGNGAFATVFAATHKKTKVKRAIKKINKNQLSREEKENILSEIKYLSQCDHPNIMKIYEFY